MKIALLIAASVLVAMSEAMAAPPLADDTILVRGVKPVLSRASPSADLESSIRVASDWIKRARSENDPRAYGYAQAALSPWWSKPDAPADVLRIRAHIFQVDHRFDAAKRDLAALIAMNSRDSQARLDLATLFVTTADYKNARLQCTALAAFALGPPTDFCVAQIDGIEGNARGAVARLERTLATNPQMLPTTQAWALTLIAELNERIGADDRARMAFGRAIALAPNDHYARIAFTDFLLAQGENTKVLTLLSRPPDRLSEAEIVRVAIAMRRENHPRFYELYAVARARLTASAARGVTPHLREAALFALHAEGDTQAAAMLALKNWESQREPIDALLLLDAGRVAQRPDAIALSEQWIRTTRFEHPSLRVR